MSPEHKRIEELIGALSETFYRNLESRDGEPGFSSFTEILRHYEGDCRPETEEETAIWMALTDPAHYGALVSYTDAGLAAPVNGYAKRLYAALRAMAEDRRRAGRGRDMATGDGVDAGGPVVDGN